MGRSPPRHTWATGPASQAEGFDLWDTHLEKGLNLFLTKCTYPSNEMTSHQIFGDWMEEGPLSCSWCVPFPTGPLICLYASVGNFGPENLVLAESDTSVHSLFSDDLLQLERCLNLSFQGRQVLPSQMKIFKNCWQCYSASFNESHFPFLWRMQLSAPSQGGQGLESSQMWDFLFSWAEECLFTLWTSEKILFLVILTARINNLNHPKDHESRKNWPLQQPSSLPNISDLYHEISSHWPLITSWGVCSISVGLISLDRTLSFLATHDIKPLESFQPLLEPLFTSF